MSLFEGRGLNPVAGCRDSVENLGLKWLMAVDHWNRSTRELMEAYEGLKKQLEDLSTTLEARNKALEESLRKEERLRELLSTILEALPVGVLVWDGEEKFLNINSTGRRLLGLEGHSEVRSLGDVVSGSTLKGVLQELIGCARGGTIISRDVSVPSGNGGVWHLLLRTTPLGETGGAPRGGIVSIEDVTDLKNLQEEMSRKQRLAAMGEMAASIVHEVRNPLGAVRLMASLMVEEEHKEARAKISFQMEEALEALDGLLKSLLQFARPIKPKIKSLNLNEIVSDCLAFIGPLADQKKVRILLEEAPSGFLVPGDCELLKQAILNILLNSIQAMPKGGEIRAWIEPCEEMGQMWVEMVIEDTGTGIPAHVLPRVFDPFFTTKPDGSGLGLSIVHNIVVAHGGTIRIESQENRGTRVKIRLPRE